MTSRALVLGGGGIVGIAWESGVLYGLREGGLDAGIADLIVGTSAGSVVGSQLAVGVGLDMMVALQRTPASASGAPPIDVNPEHFLAVAAMLAPGTDVSPEQMRAIGQIALNAPVGDEAAYLQRFALFGLAPWPARRLLLTAIDAESGEFKVWERSSVVPLHLAIASSCAVPGIFPPVTIDGQRYMDGGMRSGTNADLAAAADVVLIIAPIHRLPGDDAATPSRLQREATALQQAGKEVAMIVPDAETLQAFGPNLLDPARTVEAVEAGIRQGRAAAAACRVVWESGSSTNTKRINE